MRSIGEIRSWEEYLGVRIGRERYHRTAYRLESVHPIHQVSKEARERAEDMAREGLAYNLTDFDMVEVDWASYDDPRKVVDLLI